jgi:hypothetical protein
MTQQRATRMTPSQWVLPKNHQEICDVIVQSLPRQEPSISFQTLPLTSVMELFDRAESGERIVHIVNFDREHPLAAFDTSVAKSRPQQPVKSVALFSPEADDPAQLTFTDSPGRVTFTVPGGARVYAMVVIAQ